MPAKLIVFKVIFEVGGGKAMPVDQFPFYPACTSLLTGTSPAQPRVTGFEDEMAEAVGRTLRRPSAAVKTSLRGLMLPTTSRDRYPSCLA